MPHLWLLEAEHPSFLALRRCRSLLGLGLQSLQTGAAAQNWFNCFSCKCSSGCFEDRLSAKATKKERHDLGLHVRGSARFLRWSRSWNICPCLTSRYRSKVLDWLQGRTYRFQGLRITPGACPFSLLCQPLLGYHQHSFKQGQLQFYLVMPKW